MSIFLGLCSICGEQVFRPCDKSFLVECERCGAIPLNPLGYGPPLPTISMQKRNFGSGGTVPPLLRPGSPHMGPGEVPNDPTMRTPDLRQRLYGSKWQGAQLGSDDATSPGRAEQADHARLGETPRFRDEVSYAAGYNEGLRSGYEMAERIAREAQLTAEAADEGERVKLFLGGELFDCRDREEATLVYRAHGLSSSSGVPRAKPTEGGK